VDQDLWLKLDNRSPVWEIESVALFHLVGQLLCPCPVFSLPKEKGQYGGGLPRVTFRSPPYITLSISDPLIVH
jgi:hypothetical protein